VFRLPDAAWPDPPGARVPMSESSRHGAPTGRAGTPVPVEAPEQPPVVHEPPPEALAAPSKGPLRGAWARRAAAKTPPG